MSKKPFDIYDYVHNNKITLKVEGHKGTTVAKAYNDIRKTNLSEVKIVNGKFSLAENLEDRKLSNEVKKHFLEIISTYNTFQDQMKRQSDMTEVANTLGAIVEAAKEMTLRESGDWFDAVTVKRNMQELDKLGKSFDKFAMEAKAMDERLHSLYEDMGHILNRYYEISDIPTEVMRERLGNKTEQVIRENFSKGELVWFNRGQNERGMRVTTPVVGILSKIVGSKNVEIKVISPSNSKGDTFTTEKNNLKLFPQKGKSVRMDVVMNSGQGSGSQSFGEVEGVVVSADPTTQQIAIKNKEGKTIKLSLYNILKIK